MPQPTSPAAVWLRTDELVPWIENPREHSDEHIEEIALSIESTAKAAAKKIGKVEYDLEDGFGMPIVAKLEDKEIIAGHGRLLAAHTLEMSWVPVRLMDLTPEAAHRLARADNRMTEKGKWDLDKLIGQLRDENAIDLAAQGWNPEEIADLVNQHELPNFDPTDGPNVRLDFKKEVECPHCLKTFVMK